MYTKHELRKATKIIKRIAREHNVSEAQVRADMLEAMRYGRQNPDSTVQARWAEFKYAGNEPTVEEFILWTTSLIKQ